MAVAVTEASSEPNGLPTITWDDGEAQARFVAATARWLQADAGPSGQLPMSGEQVGDVIRHIVLEKLLSAGTAMGEWYRDPSSDTPDTLPP